MPGHLDEHFEQIRQKDQRRGEERRRRTAKRRRIRRRRRRSIRIRIRRG